MPWKRAEFRWETVPSRGTHNREDPMLFDGSVTVVRLAVLCRQCIFYCLMAVRALSLIVTDFRLVKSSTMSKNSQVVKILI